VNLRMRSGAPGGHAGSEGRRPAPYRAHGFANEATRGPTSAPECGAPGQCAKNWLLLLPVMGFLSPDEHTMVDRAGHRRRADPGGTPPGLQVKGTDKRPGTRPA